MNLIVSPLDIITRWSVSIINYLPGYVALSDLFYDSGVLWVLTFFLQIIWYFRNWRNIVFKIPGHCLLSISIGFSRFTIKVDDSFVSRYHFLVFNNLNFLGIPNAKIVHRHHLQSRSTYSQSLNSAILVNWYDPFWKSPPMNFLFCNRLECAFWSIIISTEEKHIDNSTSANLHDCCAVIKEGQLDACGWNCSIRAAIRDDHSDDKDSYGGKHDGGKHFCSYFIAFRRRRKLLKRLVLLLVAEKSIFDCLVLLSH